MRNVKADELARACFDLGDTVIDPSLWPKVMDSICQAAGTEGAALLQSDNRTPDIPQTEALRDMFSQYFREGWHIRDIREPIIPLLLNGKRVAVDQDIFTDNADLPTPMYNELFAPFKLRWFAGVGFRASSALWVFVMQRTIKQGRFQNDEVRLLEPLSERLTEVATLSTAVGRMALTSATNALDYVGLPAVVVDRFGCVLGQNSAADAIFDEEIRIKNRRLFVSDPAARVAFQTLYDRLMLTLDTEPLGAEPILIRRQAKPPVIVRVLPVHGAARNPFLGGRVLLTFSAMAAKPSINPALLAKLFGLTPAESRVALSIAQGLSPDEIADQAGVSRLTVRRQLKAVFEKTDTHRQGELAALLARL